jgi:acetyl esterase/lipase
MVRLLRPTADIEVDGWTRDDGSSTNLYQAIDEVSASEADYIKSDGSQNPAAYTASFTGGSETGTNSGVTIRVREMKDSAGTETTDLDVIARTATGWDIHTESYDDIDQTINAVEFTLSADEMAEFRAHGGDFADMRVRLVRRKRQTVTTSTGVTYTTSPSTLTCDIRRPSAGGPYPVVVLIVDSGFTTNDLSGATPSCIRLSQEEGFATINLGIRVAPADLAPAPMEDCGDVIDFIVANAATYNFDPDRIAFMGGSGGGYVAVWGALGGFLTAGQFARVMCAVAGSPPTDFRNADVDGIVPQGAFETFLGVTEAAAPATWDLYSPALHVGADAKPTFLAYSAGDQIPPAQGNRLAAALAAQGVAYRMLTYAGSDHGLLLLDNAGPWSEFVTWLHRYLG